MLFTLGDMSKENENPKKWGSFSPEQYPSSLIMGDTPCNTIINLLALLLYQYIHEICNLYRMKRRVVDCNT